MQYFWDSYAGYENHNYRRITVYKEVDLKFIDGRFTGTPGQQVYTGGIFTGVYKTTPVRYYELAVVIDGKWLVDPASNSSNFKISITHGDSSFWIIDGKRYE